MANTYFRFKQFAIEQQHAAMKVGTDGVLLGAWASHHNAKRALDIGTGTGLIALMLAQRYSQLQVDAVEIEPLAAQQAADNIEQSVWQARLSVQLADFIDFASSCSHSYDLIVSNPPFFNKSLQAAGTARQLARHDNSLPLPDMLAGIVELLNPDGCFCMVYPVDRLEELLALANNLHLKLQKQCLVLPDINKTAKRVLLQFGLQNKDCEYSQLQVENGARHCYTDEYKLLTKDFYLAF